MYKPASGVHVIGTIDFFDGLREFMIYAIKVSYGSYRLGGNQSLTETEYLKVGSRLMIHEVNELQR